MISFAKVTKSAYNALTPVQDRLYLIEDTGELLLNGKTYNGNDGSRDWLCFTAGASSSTVKLNKSASQTPTISLEYSTDGINWTAYTWDNLTGATITLTNIGDKVYFRGDNNEFSKNTANHYEFAMSGTIAASGNVMSLLSKDCSKTAFNTVNQRLTHLFNNCTSLVTPPKLPATTLAQSSYYSMFNGCTSLAVAPDLPATELGTYAYTLMFKNCTALTKAPALPATVMQNNCYAQMFEGCTSLAVAPDLPATTLAYMCYNRMFQGCSSLVSIPARLPAMTMADSCYNAMFKNCTSLQKPPVLPATTLASGCYYEMFRYSGLTEVPALPATTLADSCYRQMFAGCANLTEIPITGYLNATTLQPYCYDSMFGETNIKSGTRLPATTLAEHCYQWMYSWNTSITDSEEISASTYATEAMVSMFDHCTNLCRMKVPNITYWDESVTYNWLDGISGSRAFVCNANLDTSTRNASRIPSGWIPTRSAYSANALTDKWSISTSNFTFCPTTLEIDFLNVTQNVTLNAITLPSSKVGSAQMYIRWSPTYDVTITAGTGLTFVDTPHKGYLSHCLVTWPPSGYGNAELHVISETAL